MEQELLRGLATIFCMVGFAAVVYWAYTPSNKTRFEEDGRLAFSWESEEGDVTVQPEAIHLDKREEANK